MKTKYLLLILLYLTACNNKKEIKPSTVSKSAASVFELNSIWHTEENIPIHLSDLKGKVLVMVMIYTSCKAACPRLVADMKHIAEKVPSNIREDVNYVLVSIDPQHDTPERLKKFAIHNQMNAEAWTFLQGTENSVREFANVLAVKYKEISPMDFSHSNIISVFDRQGHLVHQQEGLGVDNQETIEKIIETASQHETDND
ncbi:MAG TPA: SCO family protein [Chitinophagaceae bacterium]|nr:SCO family protein [Chitinophagaceae bacterium]